MTPNPSASQQTHAAVRVLASEAELRFDQIKAYASLAAGLIIAFAALVSSLCIAGTSEYGADSREYISRATQIEDRAATALDFNIACRAELASLTAASKPDIAEIERIFGSMDDNARPSADQVARLWVALRGSSAAKADDPCAHAAARGEDVITAYEDLGSAPNSKALGWFTWAPPVTIVLAALVTLLCGRWVKLAADDVKAHRRRLVAAEMLIVDAPAAPARRRLRGNDGIARRGRGDMRRTRRRVGGAP